MRKSCGHLFRLGEGHDREDPLLRCRGRPWGGRLNYDKSLGTELLGEAFNDIEACGVPWVVLKEDMVVFDLLFFDIEGPSICVVGEDDHGADSALLFEDGHNGVCDGAYCGVIIEFEVRDDGLNANRFVVSDIEDRSGALWMKPLGQDNQVLKRNIPMESGAMDVPEEPEEPEKPEEPKEPKETPGPQE